MKIKLNGTILESNNKLVIEQWKKAGYEDISGKDEEPTNGGSKPELGTLTVASDAGIIIGDTKITVEPGKADGNSYKYKVDDSEISVTYGQNVKTWSAWDGTADITAATDKTITVVECDSSYKALKAGSATVTAQE